MDPGAAVGWKLLRGSLLLRKIDYLLVIYLNYLPRYITTSYDKIVNSNFNISYPKGALDKHNFSYISIVLNSYICYSAFLLSKN